MFSTFVFIKYIFQIFKFFKQFLLFIFEFIRFIEDFRRCVIFFFIFYFLIWLIFFNICWSELFCEVIFCHDRGFLIIQLVFFIYYWSLSMRKLNVDNAIAFLKYKYFFLLNLRLNYAISIKTFLKRNHEWSFTQFQK